MNQKPLIFKDFVFPGRPSLSFACWNGRGEVTVLISGPAKKASMQELRGPTGTPGAGIRSVPGASK
jgi:hypothetical protein